MSQFPCSRLRAGHLEDAGNLHHETFEGRTHNGGMEALIPVATLGGPMMFARIGVMSTLNRNVKRTFYPTRKDKRTNQKLPGVFFIVG
jgi:hypothetical protein